MPLPFRPARCAFLNHTRQRSRTLRAPGCKYCCMVGGGEWQEVAPINDLDLEQAMP